MLSIVVPAFDEADSLPQLHREIADACDAADIEFELIIIDDGSRDGTWKTIGQIASDDNRVSAIRFRRNFGKSAALTAGFQAARGTHIATMDADLQDDPRELPRMLSKLDEGFDLINGWKVDRKDPWHKVYPSRVFNWMIGRLMGLKLHDHNCGLKLFRREVADEIRIYGEMHRFITVMAHARGFRVTELPVHHRQRAHGRSKYGMRRFMRGFLDLLTVRFLTGYGQRPQHIVGGIGLTFFLIGILGLGYLTLLWFLTNVLGFDAIGPIGTRPLLAYSVAATILGAQALTLGLLAELIVSFSLRETDAYSISDRIGHSTADRESIPTM